MSTNINAVLAQLQARMNAVDANTPKTELAVMNAMATVLKGLGHPVSRDAFNLLVNQELDDISSSSELFDMMKLLQSVEKDFVDIRRKTQNWNAPGTYQWVVPDDVYIVWVTGSGAGGGGGPSQGSNGNPGQYSGSGGGSGACSFRFPMFVTPGETITIIVGEGGAGGLPVSPWRGESGGATSITLANDSLLLPGGRYGNMSAGVASGGSLLQGQPPYLFSGGNSTSGSRYGDNATAGDQIGRFAPGATGYSSSYSYRGGGGGAPSLFANGGDGGDPKNGKPESDRHGKDGIKGSGGGGAARYYSGSDYNGGKGGDGFLVLEY